MLLRLWGRAWRPALLPPPRRFLATGATQAELTVTSVEVIAKSPAARSSDPPPLGDKEKYTIDNVRNHYLPQSVRDAIAAELPFAPSNFIDEPWHFIHHWVEKSPIFTSYPATPATAWTCLFETRPLDTGTIMHARGCGPTKKSARNAAALHLVGLLQGNRLLNVKGWAPRKPVHESPTHIVEEESPAQDVKYDIVDVYNHAVSRNCLPNLSLTECWIVRKNKAKKARGLEVIVDLNQHGVMGRGVAAGRPSDAWGVAATEFMAAAKELNLPETWPLNTHTYRGFMNHLVRNGVRSPWLPEPTYSNLTMFGGGVWKLVVPITTTDQATHEVTALSKSDATKLALLVQAMSLARRYPALMAEFADTYRETGLLPLSEVRAIECNLTQTTVNKMAEIIRVAASSDVQRSTREGGESSSEPAAETGKDESSRREARSYQPPSPFVLTARSKALESLLEHYETHPHYKARREQRSELPMYQHASQVVELVQNNTFSIIVGATGSGKTTQVPQILLDDAIRKGQGASCNIICCQPRRIAAKSVASRVAFERGIVQRETVGHHVRFDRKLPSRHGGIVYCTTGILYEQCSRELDSVMERASHIILDEIHERSITLDLTLATLKLTMADRARRGLKVPRLILMSATVDTDKVAAYFQDVFSSSSGEVAPNSCPTLTVPGRMFPVKHHHVEQLLPEIQQAYDHGESTRLLNCDASTLDYLKTEMPGSDQPGYSAKSLEEGATFTQQGAVLPVGLVVATIAHIVKKAQDDDAILVFLPGLRDIRNVDKALRELLPLGLDFNDESQFSIFQLHSTMHENHSKVFDPLPHGCRKIILSTNIAETSVTLPDVRHVIDAGMVRVSAYDHQRRTTGLSSAWASKSNVKQRAGRAGRVADGMYYALYTRPRHEAMLETPLPEILHLNLQSTYLSVKSNQPMLGISVEQFLSCTLDAPSPNAVEVARRELEDMGGLDSNDSLTPLGHLLSSLLPMEPAFAKMVLLGVIFRCLDPMLILGIVALRGSPFFYPVGAKAEVRDVQLTKFARGLESDHMVNLFALTIFLHIQKAEGWARAESWAREHFLSSRDLSAYAMELQQLRDTLGRMGILVPEWGSEEMSSEGFRMTTPLSSDDDDANAHSTSEHLVRALLVGGLSPNLALRQGRGLYRTADQDMLALSSYSVNFGRDLFHLPDVVGFGAIRTSTEGKQSIENARRILSETTSISPLAAILFGGKLAVGRAPRTLTVNDWLTYEVPSNAIRDVLLQFHGAIKRVAEDAFADLWKIAQKHKARQGRRTLVPSARNQDDASVSTESHAARDALVGALPVIMSMSSVTAKGHYRLDLSTDTPTDTRPKGLFNPRSAGTGSELATRPESAPRNVSRLAVRDRHPTTMTTGETLPSGTCFTVKKNPFGTGLVASENTRPQKASSEPRTVSYYYS